MAQGWATAKSGSTSGTTAGVPSPYLLRSKQRKTKKLEKYFFSILLEKGFSVAHTESTLPLSFSPSHVSFPLLAAPPTDAVPAPSFSPSRVSLLHCLLFWLQAPCLLSQSLALFSPSHALSPLRVSLPSPAAVLCPLSLPLYHTSPFPLLTTPRYRCCHSRRTLSIHRCCHPRRFLPIHRCCHPRRFLPIHRCCHRRRARSIYRCCHPRRVLGIWPLLLHQ